MNRSRIGEVDYEQFLSEGNANFAYKLPNDEWDAIALGYTSGTVSRTEYVYVYVCTYVHVCVYIYTHTCMHTYLQR